MVASRSTRRSNRVGTKRVSRRRTNALTKVKRANRRSRHRRSRHRRSSQRGGARIEVGTAQADGYKSPTEDRVFTIINENYSILCVFDGHGGFQTSDYVSNNLAERIDKRLATAFAAAPATFIASVPDILKEEFKKIDGLVNGNWILGDQGSTGTVCVVTPTHVIAANIGDSPAFIFSKAGVLLNETSDHDCYNPDEEARVAAKGAACVISGPIKRLPSGLAVTRAFGDVRHGKKTDIVIAEPQTYTWKREPDTILCICSDSFVEGIDMSVPTIRAMYDNKHIVEELLPFLTDKKWNLQEAARAAVDARIVNMRKSGDNTSLVLAALP